MKFLEEVAFLRTGRAAVPVVHHLCQQPEKKIKKLVKFILPNTQKKCTRIMISKAMVSKGQYSNFGRGRGSQYSILKNKGSKRQTEGSQVRTHFLAALRVS